MSEVKAIWVPLGDQVGELSIDVGVFGVRFVSPVPSRLTTQMSR